jgi:hypothetical protein
MKKLLMIALVATMGIQSAFANQMANDLSVENFSQEQTLGKTDLNLGDQGAALPRGANLRGGEAIVGGIIGGIIGGAIVAGSQDRHYPERRGYPLTCYAQGARGEYYWATDMSANWAQRMAMDQCYYYSWRCRPTGCEYGRRW